MKLQKILSRLEKKHPKKIDLSLNRTINLLKKLGNPQDKLKNVKANIYKNLTTSWILSVTISFNKKKLKKIKKNNKVK